MAILKPNLYLASVLDIDLDLIKKLGVKALLLDVDNTLAVYRTDKAIEGVKEWINTMKENGISLFILSNAKPKRIERFAKSVGLEYFSLSLKPLPFKMGLAVRKTGFKKSEVALVGDQLFTDMLGGNLLGIKTVLVDVIEPETTTAFIIKRKIEKLFSKAYEKGVF